VRSSLSQALLSELENTVTVSEILRPIPLGGVHLHLISTQCIFLKLIEFKVCDIFMGKFTLLKRLFESFNSIGLFIINKNRSVPLDLEIREQNFYAHQNSATRVMPLMVLGCLVLK